MPKIKKIELKKRIIDMPEFFTGELDSVIISLQDLKHQYSGKYNKLEIVEEYNGYGDCDSSTYHLYGIRLETDKEYNNRLNREAKKRFKKKLEKSKREEKEKEQLRKLIKKYPKEIVNKE